ncbi:alpha/beta hydrolase [Bacillus sp. B1-b2]|uniref:alpha/beta hydrolase n=1 Tax=Bacillus sp. B1-b2 TaxID=2653201 RepID=UPI0012626601|nr:alpha/beta hydrolase [Bacillus sp. B1-b2]KAB7667735.1 alpha/beta hydrolase [Bacillus sp. B1-b2]
MIRYDKSLIEILQKDTKIIENDGLSIILKPSPGEERVGYLDPIEMSIMEEHWAGQKQREQPTSPPSIEEIVSMIRESMGFPNLNLNTVEIHTKYEEITSGSGNKVGLWRYYPRKSYNKNRPAFLFFHGGGWLGGSVYTVENFCKLIAELADAVVFNVDYSLAPEKPYPNGINDSYSAVKHVYDNANDYGVNPNKISVGGDSAGGNLAAALSLKARDEGLSMIAMQVLLYPAVLMGDVSVDGYEWREDDFEVSEEHADIIKNRCLSLGRPSKVEEDVILSSYITSTDLKDPYVNPALALSHEGLPKAIIVAAEFDGLRIQNEAYAKQLQAAGVDTTCYRYKGMTHAFIDKLGYLPQAEDLCMVIANELRDL